MFFEINEVNDTSTQGKKRNCFACWVIFHDFLSSAEFLKINFFKKQIHEYH